MPMGPPAAGALKNQNAFEAENRDEQLELVERADIQELKQTRERMCILCNKSVNLVEDRKDEILTLGSCKRGLDNSRMSLKH